MTNKEYADSLRMIADFYQIHEEIEAPQDGEFKVFNLDSKEKMARLARAFGTSEKEFGDTLFCLKKKFGSLELQAFANRYSICERVVTGKKTIEVPAKPATEAKTIEVEEYEWRCEEPLLAVKS